jgi:hypothetical protein
MATSGCPAHSLSQPLHSQADQARTDFAIIEDELESSWAHVVALERLRVASYEEPEFLAARPVRRLCQNPSLKPKFPASRQNTGNFVDSGFGSASTAAKKGFKSQPYGRIPYAF